MADYCQIPNAVEKVFAASHCSVAYIGGSLTTAAGASNTAETSWRALFTQYLYREYHTRYQCQVSEVMGGLGASESYPAAFTLVRNVLPNNPDLAMVEFCVNDRVAPDKELVLKGMEGLVRQLMCAAHRCDVMIVGAGCRPGSNPKGPDGCIDQSLHRQVAVHYDLPFVDVQGYIHRTLAERGQTWDDVSIEFAQGDDLHLNDYGNRLWFEALRESFEEQVGLFQAGKRKERKAPVPAPIFSDEFQHVEIIDPARKHPAVVLEGPWQRKPDGYVPWYFDHLLMGRPGARLTLTFTGSAVCVWGLMYNNGLKLNGELDGEKIAGPYFRHTIEFGKGMVLAHGLPHARHVLVLTVGEPNKKHNKQPDPTVQIGYLGIARRPEAAIEKE
jgi:lysophospholipase L1-like esterase